MLRSRHQAADGQRQYGTPSAADPLARIERLHNLRQEGALTESEFESEKKKVLSSA